jgi:hypothetical protein
LVGTGPRPRFGLQNVLDGGAEIFYERPLVAGDVITMTTQLVEAEVKESKRLGTMVVATAESTGRDAGGEVVFRERSQFIFY